MKKTLFLLLLLMISTYVFGFKIHDNLNQKEYELDDFYWKLKQYQVVYVGETHDNLYHHKAQLEIIKLLKNENISVGMEYFNRRYNKVLANYFINNKFSFKDFLEKSNYFNTWGFDINLYEDIFLFMNKNKINGFGINLDRKVVSAVSRRGLKNLSIEERLQLPFLHIEHFPEHRKYIGDIFNKMGSKMGFNKEMFNNFYHAQVVWEDVMAHSVWAELKKSADKKIVVIVGQGHIVYKFGIPERVFNRLEHNYCTIVPVDKNQIEDYMKSHDYADYLIMY